MKIETENFDFLDQNCQKGLFLVDNGKSEHHHCILHIHIALNTKFHFTQTILNFEAKSAQEGVFSVETKKVNITTELNSTYPN